MLSHYFISLPPLLYYAPRRADDYAAAFGAIVAGAAAIDELAARALIIFHFHHFRQIAFASFSSRWLCRFAAARHAIILLGS